MKFSKIIALTAVGAGALVFSFAGVTSAHVLVKPSDAQTATYQTFSAGVPTEGHSPTVSVKLEVPEDLTDVTPTAKPGWTIQADKQGTDEDAPVTAITWTGGEVGVGFRDDFTFSAKTPDHPMDLEWKVYQTHKDGTVVSWDQPGGGDTDVEGATTGPFSVTKVATDSDQDKALRDTDGKVHSAQNEANKAFYASMIGIILAGIALVKIILITRKPKI
jgi:uncharacterized protein YcnI